MAGSGEELAQVTVTMRLSSDAAHELQRLISNGRAGPIWAVVERAVLDRRTHARAVMEADFAETYRRDPEEARMALRAILSRDMPADQVDDMITTYDRMYLGDRGAA